MRTTRRRLIVCAVSAATGAARAAAGNIFTTWQEVPIPPEAVADDPRLADMRCAELLVTTSAHWASAGINANLGFYGTFYRHPAATTYTRPDPALVAGHPGLAFSTYVTAPADNGVTGPPIVIEGFPASVPLSFGDESSPLPGVLSVGWGNMVLPPPGTDPILRMTYPRAATFPDIHPASSVSQVAPDEVAPILPAIGARYNPWRLDTDGSWHVASNWMRNRVPNSIWDIAVLDVGGSTVRTVTYSQGFSALFKIESQEHIVLSGGTLTTVLGPGGIEVSNGMTVTGGTLKNTYVSGSTITVGPGGGRFEAVNLWHGADLLVTGGAPLVVTGGLMLGAATLNTGAVVRFQGAQELSSTGSFATIRTRNGSAVQIDGGSALTVRSNVSFTGGGAIGARTPGTAGLSTLVNLGLLTADATASGMSLAPDVLVNAGTITAREGRAITISAASVSTSGAIVAEPGSSVELTGTLNVQAGSMGGPGAVRANSVTVNLARKVGTGPLRLTTLNLPDGAALDLAGGGIVYDYSGATPLDAVRARIVSGYANGSWSGTGINSSAAAANPALAVGYAEAQAVLVSFPATYMGEPVDASTLLVRLVRSGDANLDGAVNLADFNRLAAGFGATGGARWSDGDFNYDGIVNLSDFNLLAASFGLSAAGSGVTPQDWSALAAAVPEPSSLVATLSMLLLMPRRRRPSR